ncbi:hypothetical protein M422DRAFT_192707, partial [Sphaerobolus stellatus SS14]
ISLICLNLPPSLHYKWENMFLAGVTPGPREPSMEEVDHYITVIIESFLELWDPGVYLMKSAKYPLGSVIRCALVPFVADMKGTQKTAGTKQCGLCATTQAQVVSGPFLDPKEFIRITFNEYHQKAQHWHNAGTITERKSLYNKDGIQWTPWLLLPHWDPTHLVMVDPMHAFLEGVVAAHV